MTDEQTLTQQMNHVLNIHDINTDDVLLYERGIGNGPQYAIRVFEPDSDTIAWESPWYTTEEMEIYLRGIDNLDRIAEYTE